MSRTVAEENYLKAIFKISEKSQKSAGTNAIAAQLSTTPASVTDMIKKLADRKLVDYEPYRGVSLTPAGIKVATQLIRKHRLWEVFLVDKLRFSWEEVHDIAEQLEHIKSEDLVLRLDAFLDYPKFDPHGDPIPNAQGKFTIRNRTPLSDLFVNQQGVLVGLKENDSSFLQYLNELNIKLGTHFVVQEKVKYDQSIKVLLDHKQEAFLSEKTAQNLLIKT